MKDNGHEEDVQVNDRRRFTEEGESRGEVAEEAVDAPAVAISPEEFRLWQQRAEAAEAKLREFAESFRRYKDEHDAIRMRLERDREQRVRESLGRSFLRILDAVDHLEMALQYSEGNPLADGLRLALKGIYEALVAEGMEKLSLVGSAFDPQYAEAVAMVPVDNPELHNIVLAEMRTGFALNGFVLRPAQVRVGSHQD